MERYTDVLEEDKAEVMRGKRKKTIQQSIKK